MTNTRKSATPVEVRTVPQQAIAAALKLAEGDHSRLKIEPDGTVTVLNKPRDSHRSAR